MLSVVICVNSTFIFSFFSVAVFKRFFFFFLVGGTIYTQPIQKRIIIVKRIYLSY